MEPVPASRLRSGRVRGDSPSGGKNASTQQASEKRPYWLPIDETHNKEKPTGTNTRMQFHRRHNDPCGNTIIRVEDTNFRISRYRLTRQSNKVGKRIKEQVATFHGRGFVRSKDVIETFESKFPVLRLAGNAEDFAILLDALNDGTILINDPPFATIAPILRASTLHGFGKLRKWATAELEAMWMCDCDAISPEIKPFAIETIVLARECGLREYPIMTRAMYEVARSTDFNEALVRLIKAGEGPRPGFNHSVNPRARLSSDEISKLLSLRSFLSDAWKHHVLDRLGEAPPSSEDNRTTRADASSLYGSCTNQAHRADSVDHRIVVVSHLTKILISSKFAFAFEQDPVLGFNLLASLPIPEHVYKVGVEKGEMPVLSEYAIDNMCREFENADAVANGAERTPHFKRDKGVVRALAHPWNDATRDVISCPGCFGQWRETWVEARQRIWEEIPVRVGIAPANVVGWSDRARARRARVSSGTVLDD